MKTLVVKINVFIYIYLLLTLLADFMIQFPAASGNPFIWLLVGFRNALG
jgi:hypothetical protein